MSDFKCISCGEVKANSKECSCPVCGYKMFETPYDRATLLKSEIRSFVCRLRLTEIADESLSYFREEKSEKGKAKRFNKKQDDERFPDFQTIQHYVCSSTKTEMFYERMNESIQQIQQHLQMAYVQQYQVDLQNLQSAVEQLDESLANALDVLNINVKPSELALPTITLDYSETPDKDLLPIAESILSGAMELSRKIFRFIKQNNIYGTAYRDKPPHCFIKTKETDYLAALAYRNLHAGRTGTTRDETHGKIEAAEKMPLLMGEKLGIEIV